MDSVRTETKKVVIVGNRPVTLRREDYSLPTQNSLPAVGQTLPGGLVPQGFQKVLAC